MQTTCAKIRFSFSVIINLIPYIFIEFDSSISNLVTYLDFISSSVNSQRQFDVLYYDFIFEFDLASQTILLRKIFSYGHSSSYINQIRSSLTNRQSSARVLDTSSPSFNISGYYILNNYSLALCVFCKAFILYIYVINFSVSLIHECACILIHLLLAPSS